MTRLACVSMSVGYPESVSNERALQIPEFVTDIPDLGGKILSFTESELDENGFLNVIVDLVDILRPLGKSYQYKLLGALLEILIKAKDMNETQRENLAELNNEVYSAVFNLVCMEDVWPRYNILSSLICY